mgnify:CR=1 FL=1
MAVIPKRRAGNKIINGNNLETIKLGSEKVEVK